MFDGEKEERCGLARSGNAAKSSLRFYVSHLDIGSSFLHLENLKTNDTHQNRILSAICCLNRYLYKFQESVLFKLVRSFSLALTFVIFP